MRAISLHHNYDIKPAKELTPAERLKAKLMEHTYRTSKEYNMTLFDALKDIVLDYRHHYYAKYHYSKEAPNYSNRELEMMILDFVAGYNTLDTFIFNDLCDYYSRSEYSALNFADIREQIAAPLNSYKAELKEIQDTYTPIMQKLFKARRGVNDVTDIGGYVKYWNLFLSGSHTLESLYKDLFYLGYLKGQQNGQKEGTKCSIK